MSFVLEAPHFRLLEGLRLAPRKTMAGRVRGERLTRRKGISIEFADYRDYVDGDDLRHLDWNVLARLQSPVIKTYQDEEDLAAHLLLDCSLSMGFGEPTKFEVARRIACAVGYISLCGQDAAFPRALGRRQEPMAALRGRVGYHRLAAWASEAVADSKRGIAETLREFAVSTARPGLAVVISDGLDPSIGAAIRLLGGRGHEVGFVQILSREELDPDIEGDLRLLDVETESMVEITATGHALREYRSRLAEHCQSIAEECRRVGGRYLRTTNGDSLETFLRDGLKRGGWVTS
jgi:uncharacterized protein (DUF58 family)